MTRTSARFRSSIGPTFLAYNQATKNPLQKAGSLFCSITTEIDQRFRLSL